MYIVVLHVSDAITNTTTRVCVVNRNIYLNVYNEPLPLNCLTIPTAAVRTVDSGCKLRQSLT